MAGLGDSRGATPRLTAATRMRGDAFRTRMMPYPPYSIADQLVIPPYAPPQAPAPDEALAPGQMEPLRTLLHTLAGVRSRAGLLEVIASSVGGLIGASVFGVLERPPGRVSTLLWSRGDEALIRRVAGHARVRETLRYGASHYAAAGHPGGGVSPHAGEPVASIPLWGLGGTVCGALVLAELLPATRELGVQDRRFLTLLASEAGRLLCTLPTGPCRTEVA